MLSSCGEKSVEGLVLLLHVHHRQEMEDLFRYDANMPMHYVADTNIRVCLHGFSISYGLHKYMYYISH